ncbi:hypothetical protein TrLO_g9551 [Triparma laevis f. longispina]|uniref:Uncharacterized protein n=1 Tax=Triparma laevis f. longispina TaxID=1714387 RepID=A0A9W6ZHI2_9STRA|nr:hypothetical protein TrLO_g9551 [Triparma laevis f. longispina]
MEDISLRRGAQGFLTLVTGVCAIFLFPMMSADRVDEMTLLAVAVAGSVASGVVVISEIHYSSKAQRRRLELSGIGMIEEQQRAPEVEEPVEECSWGFVGISFLLTSMFTAFMLLYGVTLEEHYSNFGDVISPIAGTALVIGCFCKPKRTNIGYKCFLYFHFISFAIVSEIVLAA